MKNDKFWRGASVFLRVGNALPLIAGIIYIALITMSLFSCNRHLLPATSSDVRDSIRTERVEVIRFDTVRVPVPVERVEAAVTADTTSTLTTSLARSTAGLRDGLLYHTLENRQDGPIKAVVSVKDTETTKEQVRREVIREPYPVEMPLTWWQRFSMVAGRLAMCWIVGRLVLKRFIL